MNDMQRAPSAARNREPILAVLRQFLPATARVLEIASGSGEHAVFFAKAMPDWDWRPSDPDADARRSTAAWIAAEGLSNVRAPLAIDVRDAEWSVPGSYDAIVAINMIHIAPWEAALGLTAGAGRLLRVGGVLYLYGPYMRNGRHTAPSNEAFDGWLKQKDARFGVRDLGAVEAAADAAGFELNEVVEMPANNLSLIFVRR